MAKFTIDGNEYDFDALPEEAKQQLQSMQFVDAELARLSAQTAVYQTARIGYSRALKSLLDSVPPQLGGDTIKFS